MGRKLSWLVLLCLVLPYCNSCPEQVPEPEYLFISTVNYVTNSQNCLAKQWQTYKDVINSRLSLLTQKTDIFSGLGSTLFQSILPSKGDLANKTDLYKLSLFKIQNKMTVVKSKIEELKTGVLSDQDKNFWNYLDQVTLTGNGAVNNVSNAFFSGKLKVPGCDKVVQNEVIKMCDVAVNELSVCANYVLIVSDIEQELDNALQLWVQQFFSLQSCTNISCANNIVLSLGKTSDSIVTSLTKTDIMFKKLSATLTWEGKLCIKLADNKISENMRNLTAELQKCITNVTTTVSPGNGTTTVKITIPGTSTTVSTGTGPTTTIKGSTVVTTASPPTSSTVMTTSQIPPDDLPPMGDPLPPQF